MSFRRNTVRRCIGIFTYCLALFFSFDFLYTRWHIVVEEAFERPHDEGIKKLRIGDARVDHGFAANFDGQDSWVNGTYRIQTNSLGFKDASVRQVALVPSTKRILLIGDSITEGIGIPFDETFAGRLYAAGLARTPQVEFLNAAVASYSPVIYLQKIKYLLELGLHFDEVVVFPDISDIQDEATSYFCFDDEPQYRTFCPSDGALASHLSITWATYLELKSSLSPPQPSQRRRGETRGTWTLQGFDAADTYNPLGLEGGIKRAVKNMDELASLLAQHSIKMSVAVYPWPAQLEHDDRDSRQIAIWRDFCASRCARFINLFPAVFAEKDAHSDWLARLFISGDVHYTSQGNQILFGELERHLLADQIISSSTKHD